MFSELLLELELWLIGKYTTRNFGDNKAQLIKPDLAFVHVRRNLPPTPTLLSRRSR